MKQNNKNKKLHQAKEVKFDEFYTSLEDIETELSHYYPPKNDRNVFKDKVIYCNCDDYEFSRFVTFFLLKFRTLELKELIVTCKTKILDTDSKKQKLIVNKENLESIESKFGFRFDFLELNEENTLEFETKRSILKDFSLELDLGCFESSQNLGSYNCEECLRLLEKCDIVVTNPPFSLFIDISKTIRSFNKDFIMIGNKLSLGYVFITNMMLDGKLFLSKNIPKKFIDRDLKETKQVKLTEWFSTIETKREYKEIKTGKFYYGNEAQYKFLDNNDNILYLESWELLPEDYDGIIAVPVSFFNIYWNPELVEFLGSDATNILDFKVEKPLIFNQRECFRRFFIRFTQKHLQKFKKS